MNEISELSRVGKFNVLSQEPESSHPLQGAHSLIHLSPPDQPLSREYLDAPGGFVWWYVDMVNEHGDGAVVIWSWGLPFLPGLAHRARQSRGMMPKFRPSLNICIYKRHELDCYILQEYTPEEASWSECGGKWEFGQTKISVEETDSELEVHMEINAPLPGSTASLEGTIKVKGLKRLPAMQESLVGGVTQAPDHDWTPRLAPATGVVSLVHGESKERYNFSARAYHDRNGGMKPLHELGFSHWIWGRLPFEEKELIYYILWPREGGAPTILGLEIDKDGTTNMLQDLSLELEHPKRTLGGMVFYNTVRISHQGQPWLSVDVTSNLDSGPFYLRQFVEATNSDGEQCVGMAEACDPDRVDLRRFEPFVRMRVGAPKPERDSVWRPLFTGPRRGRVRRFFQQAWQGA